MIETIFDHLKAAIGYTDVARGCGGCRFFKEDASTDHFGPGDLCIRNPDVSFGTTSKACCNRWEPITTAPTAQESK